MTSFLEKVAEAGLPPPPFDPFVTRVYDVPYEGSRSVRFAIWYLKDLTHSQQKIAEDLIGKLGKRRPPHANFLNLYHHSLGESFLAVHLRIAGDNLSWVHASGKTPGRFKSPEERQRDLQEQGRPPIRPTFSPCMGYQFGRRYEIFVNQTKESLDLMSEESKEQIAKIVFIGGSVLTVFVFFLAAGAFLPPLQAKL